MLSALDLLGGVIVLVGLVGYSTLLPRPTTRPSRWLLGSFSASGVVVVCVLVALLLWNGRGTGGSNGPGALGLLSSVGPYAVGGGLLLAAGTYVKVRLWASKNSKVDHWLSRR